VPSLSTIRILQVDTERGWRGGQRQTLLVSRELAREGHHCTIAARGDEPLAARAREAGLQVIDVRPHSELAIGAAVELQRFVRRERIDIVHAQASHALSLAAMATIGTSARLVVTRHLAKPPRANPGTRWKYARANAVIAVSNAAADAVKASGVVRAPIDVIPGGVEMDRAITPASREVLASFGVRANTLLVVGVGALVPQKDPLTFVRAMAVARRAYPDVQALWVGEGELREHVEREIARLHLGDTLHLAGFRTDVDALMAAGDVFAMSSVFEGLPLVVMDAFALGIPVVATAGSGIPELVDDGATGLLAPVGDADALGAALIRVLADTQLAAALRGAALVRAREYSIERTAERTLMVYERVLGRDRAERNARTPRSQQAPSR